MRTKSVVSVLVWAQYLSVHIWYGAEVELTRQLKLPISVLTGVGNKSNLIWSCLAHAKVKSEVTPDKAL